MPGSLNFAVRFSPTPGGQARQRRQEEALRILIMGDFSGSNKAPERPGDLSQRSLMARVNLFSGLLPTAGRAGAGICRHPQVVEH